MPTNQPTADPRLGLTLGKYRLLRRLGQGGMGVVYEAEDTELQRKVAVKVLPPEMYGSRDSAARFQQEARAAARLNHPNVIAVYDVGKHERTAYLVMELVRGGSAQDELQARGALPWREATAIVAEACRGLAAAHAAGLIHRDIKPANLMRPEGGGTKLADFGLAKVTDSVGPALTGQGAILGTPFFMSPEQCGAAPVEARSDLYSLGATYFALLTGTPPFAGTNPMQVMVAHCSHAVPDPRASRAGVPEACAAIVRRAMAKEPAQRYANAEAMLAALESALAGAPAKAAVPRGSRWPVAIAASALLFVGVAASLFRGGALRPHQAANQPSPANAPIATNVPALPTNTPVAVNAPVVPANEPAVEKGPDPTLLAPARAALQARNFHAALELLDALPPEVRADATAENWQALRAEAVRAAREQAQPDLQSARALAENGRFEEAEACLTRVEALRVAELSSPLAAEREHLTAAREAEAQRVAADKERAEAERKAAAAREIEEREARERAATAKAKAERAAREQAEQDWPAFAPQTWQHASDGDWAGARRSCDEAPQTDKVKALGRVIDLGRSAEQAVLIALTHRVGKKIRLEKDDGTAVEGVIAAPPADGRLRVTLAGGKGTVEVVLLQLTAHQCITLAREGLAEGPDKAAALAIFALAARSPADADALLAHAEADRWPALADLTASAQGWTAPWSRAEIARRKGEGHR